MSVWSSIGGAVCVAVTAVGLILSWLAWRRNGAVRGMRGVAWSLLPLAAYLTGAVTLLGRLVNAVVRFAGSFVFSPKAWAGVVVVGIAAVLFLASGGLPLLNWRKARARRKARQNGGAARDVAPAGATPAVSGSSRAPAQRGSGDDDDMSDVQEILRRRGIS